MDLLDPGLGESLPSGWELQPALGEHCPALGRGEDPPLGDDVPFAPLGDTCPLVTVAAGGSLDFPLAFSWSANHWR